MLQGPRLHCNKTLFCSDLSDVHFNNLRRVITKLWANQILQFKDGCENLGQDEPRNRKKNKKKRKKKKKKKKKRKKEKKQGK
ncbi:hypothetical protein M8J77_009554 [Diaphorina citri]|nr:hypothetical protein M8J77_009554 [Diaphorina citri]